MSRMSGGDTVIVKPTNNVYTVLALVAVLASILALVSIFLKAKAYFPPSGLLPSDEAGMPTKVSPR